MPAALQARFLWLLVPALGLVELGAQVWVSHRAPTLDDWRALAPVVRPLKRPGVPVVVAPEWAEPIARYALGDAVFPVAELGRSDLGGYRRVLEISLLGAHSREAHAFRTVSETESGPFTLRTLSNPSPRPASYRLLDHVNPSDLAVSIVTQAGEQPCAYTDSAHVSAGGLFGAATFPRQRFRCGGRESSFVGITIIDDQRYRPRRCLWAQPPYAGKLRLTFSHVPLGHSLTGFAGLSYFLFRDGGRAPIELVASAGGHELGRYRHRDEWGWHGFVIDSRPLAGQTADLVLEVSSPRADARDFCFVMEATP